MAVQAGELCGQVSVRVCVCEDGTVLEEQAR